MPTPKSDREAAEAYADKTCGRRPFGGEPEKLYHYEWRGQKEGFLAGCEFKSKQHASDVADLVEALDKYISGVQKKRKSRIIFSNALQSGKLIRPDNCSKCGVTGKIDGHHEDYSKPLEVIWLCKICHAEIHYVHT